MTALRVRWEVRDADPKSPRGESPYEATRWSTREEAAEHLGFLRKCGGTAWIVKVTTLPRRVVRRTWRRGDVSVVWANQCLDLRVSRGATVVCWRNTGANDIRAQALALLGEYAPRKAGAR